MTSVRELRCVLCGGGHAPDALEYVCPDCGEVGTLDVLYDYGRLRARLDRDRLVAGTADGMWRWRDLLPLDSEARVPPLPVGDTPLLAAPRLARELGLRALWLKDEGRNPTASLKDRASAMVAARALQCGRKVVATASTGNAAAALAGVCAALSELDAIIFVPASAPAAKIAQLLVYGARVLLLEASYDEA
ncbi:MAG: pyridoxal-phosphate dependent enzyme, partial [Anaerolineaceae bacterium]|nr:pyridoxal-phosphate dependent enzyme [Anaerolineaceae bacterium]